MKNGIRIYKECHGNGVQHKDKEKLEETSSVMCQTRHPICSVMCSMRVSKHTRHDIHGRYKDCGDNPQRYHIEYNARQKPSRGAKMAVGQS